MIWQRGRQPATYNIWKLKLLSFGKFDAYLLYCPQGVEVAEHLDPVEKGCHFRWNLTLFGSGFYKIQEKWLYQGMANAYKFRPDVQKHSAFFTRNTLLFSVGWIGKPYKTDRELEIEN